MSIEIENTVQSLLVAAGVTFACKYKGERKNAMREGSTMDAWECEFTKTGAREVAQEFDFFTGLGLRAPATYFQKKQAQYQFNGLTANDISRRTNYALQYFSAVEKLRKPKAPSAASVLYSLVLDSEAGNETFYDWCGNLGFDTDSRKALATYEACQNNSNKLRKLFDRAMIEKLSEALQDY